MLDNVINKITEKFRHSVKTQITPIKNKVEKTLDTKIDLYSKALKFGVLLILFIEGTKRVNKQANEQESIMPGQIIINNYLEGKGEHN